MLATVSMLINLKRQQIKEILYLVDLLEMSLTVNSRRRISPRFWIFPEMISGVNEAVNIAFTFVFPSFAVKL